MSIVYFGSDDFARDVLIYLIEKGIDVKGIVTVPDREKGRSRKVQGTPVKEHFATQSDIPIFQPEKPSDPMFMKQLKILDADLFVVAVYGKLLKQDLLDLPKIGTINVHPSLLPKYRGPSPIQSAVLAGEKEVGVTIMEVVLELDAGDIISARKMSVDEDATFGEVREALCKMSKSLLYETIKEALFQGSYPKVPQDPAKVTFSKKISPEQAQIDFNQSASDVHNLIRGMSPRPGARCQVEISGKIKSLKILRSSIVDVEDEARFTEKSYKPGDIVFYNKEKGFVVKCQDHFLQLLSLQLEGKKEMSAKDFINGFYNVFFV